MRNPLINEKAREEMFIAEAKRRLLYDAEFVARVRTICYLISSIPELDQFSRYGTKEKYAGVELLVALGLLSAELNLETGHVTSRTKAGTDATDR